MPLIFEYRNVKLPSQFAARKRHENMQMSNLAHGPSMPQAHVKIIRKQLLVICVGIQCD